MCGRFSLSSSEPTLQEEFGLSFPGYRPRYNIAPAQPVFAIVADAVGAPKPAQLRWGLIPAWAKDPAIGSRMINARAETVAEKPAYRSAFARRRCLVLADGFFEWQKIGGGKVPKRFRLSSGKPFTFGGIWERCRLPGGVEVETCAILTTAASAFVQPIHDRMPVIISSADRERWIDPSSNADACTPLMRAYDGLDLEVYEVSTLVNSPANDRPEVLEPVTP